jgi:hypothetical protein
MSRTSFASSAPLWAGAIPEWATVRVGLAVWRRLSGGPRKKKRQKNCGKIGGKRAGTHAGCDGGERVHLGPKDACRGWSSARNRARRLWRLARLSAAVWGDNCVRDLYERMGRTSTTTKRGGICPWGGGRRRAGARLVCCSRRCRCRCRGGCDCDC